ncbi:hypothetical protein LR48_Vigan01g107200 [Vigna angularis]|uniref:Legume lectin domain-containing protein n=1 Tax=Phaseolus angularis TaxID=3914 RepID=A0A0L9TM56_PHAAN|nr:hypothetical protein LR48_Vigan01g107200 [Vigna angularis]
MVEGHIVGDGQVEREMVEGEVIGHGEVEREIGYGEGEDQGHDVRMLRKPVLTNRTIRVVFHRNFRPISPISQGLTSKNTGTTRTILSTSRSLLGETSTSPRRRKKISRLDLAGEVFHVPLTNPSLSSSGLLRVPEPLVFVDATTTLSTEFSFSISGNGDNVLFVLTAASANGSDTVAVEFVRFKDENVGDPNSSDVGIDVGSHLSLAVANASYVVRLSKWGEQKPSDREEEEEDGEGNEDDDAHASDISPGREDGHEQSVGNFHT